MCLLGGAECSLADLWLPVLCALAALIGVLVVASSLIANVLGARAFLKRYTVEVFKVSERQLEAEAEAKRDRPKRNIKIPVGAGILILVCFGVMAGSVVFLATQL